MIYDTYQSNVNKDDSQQYDILFNYYSSSTLNDASELEEKTIKYNKLLYYMNLVFIVFFIIIPIVIYYVSRFVFNKDIPIIQSIRCRIRI